MDKIEHRHVPLGEAQVPTDLLAGLLMERADASPVQRPEQDSLSAKIWAVMAVTTLLTFATLTTGYQMLFSHPIFA